MKAVKVQYTVKDSYAATNKQNIENVMNDLRQLNNPNVKYSSFLLEDGKSFVHFAVYPDEATSQIVSQLDSFGKFISELKASQPEVQPKAENLSLVASAYDFFPN